MDKKRLAYAGSTFAVAIAIGFVMQNTDALAALDTSNEAPAIAVQSASVVPTLPVAKPDVAPVMTNESSQMAVTQTEPTALEDGAEVSSDTVAEANCGVSLNLRPMPAAVLQAIVSAPCETNTRGTVHHEGMMFSFVTDAIGGAEIMVPALSTSAMVIVAFDSGEGAMADRDVPSLSNFSRTVVQWRGDMGTGLHAFERGADYGHIGHVWSGAARTAEVALKASGGFLMQLGQVETSNPFRAEVYTVPTGGADDPEVVISVETEVLAQTCGRDVAAQTIQITPNEARVVHDLTLAMPECDAIGDFVVMQAPVRDVALASR
ncbi:hypothetical protein [Algirhabdus cladophorae]|uniref:hypothetical protein n=1 Tax=Algirhabdus cladophorae TaxID=3377108 RepID=UPI003B849B42